MTRYKTIGRALAACLAAGLLLTGCQRGSRTPAAEPVELPAVAQ